MDRRQSLYRLELHYDGFVNNSSEAIRTVELNPAELNGQRHLASARDSREP